MKQKTILITGSNGFIYSNFIKYVCTNFPQYRLVGIDALLFEHSKRNTFEHPNYKFYLGDFADTQFIEQVFRIERPDWIIHAGAQSNVGASIASALPFVHSNIVGTQVMIDASLKYNVEKFFYVDTDEVYGHLQEDEAPWKETSPLHPRNPYSASKACGGLLTMAAHETHGLQFLITRCANNYGKNQSHANLVPQIIIRILKNLPINIHGNGQHMREWLYAIDNCEAAMTILHNSPMNEIYNIGANVEMTNLETVEYIGKLMNRTPKIRHIVDRPGHDLRYKLNCSKINELGWKPNTSLEQGMLQTIKWYEQNIEFYSKLINE